MGPYRLENVRSGAEIEDCDCETHALKKDREDRSLSTTGSDERFAILHFIPPHSLLMFFVVLLDVSLELLGEGLQDDRWGIHEEGQVTLVIPKRTTVVFNDEDRVVDDMNQFRLTALVMR
jgi:hypothetical protein